MSKEKLIKHLYNDIYCRLGVSKVSGIGVIAIKDIPKGINPFKNLSKKYEKVIYVNDEDIKNINPNVKKILVDFFDSNKSGEYHVFADGPNNINISYYLNHSNKPNISLVKSKKSDYYDFITNRNIKKNEELFIDYNNYN